ncbi:MAG: hypothetical protein E7171_00775 [Firmicutes bacterium]|nr:hypothetical protein [Bacillota bacterium]
MFLETVLSETNMELIYDKYDKEYLECIDPYNFANIYNLFLENKFYFIEDLIVKYLEIFTLNKDIIEDAIFALESEYGSDYIYYIGKDLSILDEAINNELERL